MKNIWKKYGKIVAAAVFLTAAGLYYGFVWRTGGTVSLAEDGHPVALETLEDETSMFQRLIGLEGAGLEGTDWEQSDWVGTDSGTAGTRETSAVSQTEPKGIYVHICGEVKNPGVYELPEGSRIFEVVEAAGGFTEQAAQASLNQAQMISDGTQIVILSLEEAEEKARLEQEMAAGIVNLNTASKEQLMTLTGIGESRAEDILRYREESGGFQSIEEIMNVPGIKESAYLKIKDSITV